MPATSVSTAIITVAGIVVASMIAVAVISQMGFVDASLRSAARSAAMAIRTSIDIVGAAQNGTYFVLYVKNTGSVPISAEDLRRTDVYLDSECARLYVYNTSGYWVWNYTETEPDNLWKPGETLVFRVYNGTALGDFPLCARVVLPNGVRDEVEIS